MGTPVLPCILHSEIALVMKFVLGYWGITAAERSLVEKLGIYSGTA